MKYILLRYLAVKTESLIRVDIALWWGQKFELHEHMFSIDWGSGTNFLNRIFTQNRVYDLSRTCLNSKFIYYVNPTMGATYIIIMLYVGYHIAESYKFEFPQRLLYISYVWSTCYCIHTESVHLK